MTQPSKEHTVRWRGQDVQVKEFCEQTDIPWDGDHELDPGSEGYDITVEVEVTLGNTTFKAGASVGGHWIVPNQEGFKYLDEQTKEIFDEALSNLSDEISSIAAGRDVKREEHRRSVAYVLEATA